MRVRILGKCSKVKYEECFLYVLMLFLNYIFHLATSLIFNIGEIVELNATQPLIVITEIIICYKLPLFNHNYLGNYWSWNMGNNHCYLKTSNCGRRSVDRAISGAKSCTEECS